LQHRNDLHTCVIMHRCRDGWFTTRVFHWWFLYKWHQSFISYNTRNASYL